METKVTSNITQLKCASCRQCDGNMCAMFNRKIEPEYNKCSLHQEFRMINPIKMGGRN